MSAHQAEVCSRLRALIAASAALDAAAVRDDATFVGDLGMESVELVRLVCRIERTFGIELDAEALAAVRTVADLVRVVAARTEAGDAPRRHG